MDSRHSNQRRATTAKSVARNYRAPTLRMVLLQAAPTLTRGSSRVISRPIAVTSTVLRVALRSGILAVYESGVLRITLGKIEEATTEAIEIPVL